jgi:HK97 family phage portal protein
VCGVSPIRLARQGIGLALAAEEYGARCSPTARSPPASCRPTSGSTSPQPTDSRRWEAKAKGIANAHKAVVLDSGAKFQQLTIPPEDAQFIETRRFQISEVARIFGVPPHMLMDTEKSTSWGTGIEQQGIGFVVYTLRPWLTRVEQRLTKMLRPNNVFAKYSVEGLLRGDTQGRYAAYAQGRQWGWLSINDIRKLEDLPPVDGGDAYITPLNMQPAGTEGTPNAAA